MFRRLFAPNLLVSLALAACAGGCASGRGGRPSDPVAAARGAATLEMRSAYPGAVHVYAESERGAVLRIASSVVTARPARFRLPPFPPSLFTTLGALSVMRIVALPLAGSGRASTGPITVRPGDVVQFTFGPDLASSTVFVR